MAACEIVSGGFTPGKRIVGLRVVMRDGLASAIRGAAAQPVASRRRGRRCRVRLDANRPGFSQVRRSVAGTLVVHASQRIARQIPASAFSGVSPVPPESLSTRIPPTPPWNSRVAAGPSDRSAPTSSRGSASLFSWGTKPSSPRDRVGPQISSPVSEHGALACEDRALEPPDDGGEFVRLRSEAWSEIENSLLERGKRRGLRDPRAVARFPRLYRESCRDLNRARAEHFSLELQEKINRLVMDARLVLYRPPRPDLIDGIARGAAVAPAAVRQMKRIVLICAVAFYGSAAIVFGWAFGDRDRAASILGEGTVSSLESMYDPQSEHFLKPRDVTNDADMFGFYISNNIGIGLGTVAAACSAGWAASSFSSSTAPTWARRRPPWSLRDMAGLSSPSPAAMRPSSSRP